jgi:hypothetical protein
VVWAPTIDLAAIRSRWRGLPFVHVCATALSLTPLDLVVWAKANAGAGNLYRSQHELLPLFTSEITAYGPFKPFDLMCMRPAFEG